MKRIVALAAMWALTGCSQTRFAPGEKTNEQEKAADGKVAHPPTEACKGVEEPIRLAIVVDNTGSNNCTPGKPQNPAKGLCGTDPIKPNAPTGDKGGYTDRQFAIWSLVTKIVKEENKRTKEDKQFLGSDIGLVSFPRGASEEAVQQNVFHSGDGGVLPKLMSNVTTIQDLDRFQKDFWSLLRFTHYPDGLTMYRTALLGALRLLGAERRDDDKRKSAVIFITDGLPTDERPSLVKETREKFKDTTLVTLSLYEPGTSLEEQSNPAKATLQTLWNSERKWAHRPGESDGYKDNEFERYWADLGKLPGEISDAVIPVEGSENLSEKLEDALSIVSGCVRKIGD